MSQFIHVNFIFAGVPKMRDLEPVMTALADDWIRYSTNGWVLWTTRTAPQIYSALIQHIDLADCLLIIPLDVDTSIGRMPPWVWEWFKSKGVPVRVGQDLERHLADHLRLPPPPR